MGGTHTVIHFGAADAADIFNECGDGLWLAEEGEGLVDEVCTEVVGLTSGGPGLILPCALERHPVAIKAGRRR